MNPISEIARPEVNSNKISHREAARRVYTMSALEQMLHGKCWGGEIFKNLGEEVNTKFLYVLKILQKMCAKTHLRRFGIEKFPGLNPRTPLRK